MQADIHIPPDVANLLTFVPIPWLWCVLLFHITLMTILSIFSYFLIRLFYELSLSIDWFTYAQPAIIPE